MTSPEGRRNRAQPIHVAGLYRAGELERGHLHQRPARAQGVALPRLDAQLGPHAHVGLEVLAQAGLGQLELEVLLDGPVPGRMAQHDAAGVWLGRRLGRGLVAVAGADAPGEGGDHERGEQRAGQGHGRHATRAPSALARAAGRC